MPAVVDSVAADPVVIFIDQALVVANAVVAYSLYRSDAQIRCANPFRKSSSKNFGSQSEGWHERGDYHDAQLCFACRLRAKVSSFPLADRLAERRRAWKITR